MTKDQKSVLWYLYSVSKRPRFTVQIMAKYWDLPEKDLWTALKERGVDEKYSRMRTAPNGRVYKYPMRSKRTGRVLTPGGVAKESNATYAEVLRNIRKCGSFTSEDGEVWEVYEEYERP